jgi:prolyl-tRNA synthetase
MAERITARDKDFSKWYTDVIMQAKLADYSPVKGCMVIRENGYAIWENIRSVLDKMFKNTGHKNAYFPVFIPESFLKKEAEHVEGFAPECAVVTHGGGKKLEEPLVIRPTSETIINSMFSKWVNSYRDLPILINQWANVVRWEMRTKLFLRTTEFLWQEGHTCHETKEEAVDETKKMLAVYKDFVENYMAIPVIDGIKTENEKFAGAVDTYSIEMLMQDGKGLQGGTSHFLGQNFAKAFNTKFQGSDGKQSFVWQTSWGVSTRLVGALIMVHSDDKGLVLPPRLAPLKAVIIPIMKKDFDNEKLLSVAKQIEEKLKDKISIMVDDSSNMSPGFKFHKYEVEGVPVRIDIGPKDLESGSVTVVRRDTGEKQSVKISDVEKVVIFLMDEIQNNLFKKAKKYLNDNTHTVDSYDEFKKKIEKDGGMYLINWCGSTECEEKIKKDTKATPRCISFNFKEEKGECICCKKETTRRIHFAKAH